MFTVSTVIYPDGFSDEMVLDTLPEALRATADFMEGVDDGVTFEHAAALVYASQIAYWTISDDRGVIGNMQLRRLV